MGWFDSVDLNYLYFDQVYGPFPEPDKPGIAASRVKDREFGRDIRAFRERIVLWCFQRVHIIL